MQADESEKLWELKLVSWSALPVLDLTGLFPGAVQMPPSLAGFPDSCQVFQFLDGTGRHAFAVGSAAGSTVASFGSVIVDEELATRIADAERKHENRCNDASARRHARR